MISRASFRLNNNTTSLFFVVSSLNMRKFSSLIGFFGFLIFGAGAGAWRLSLRDVDSQVVNDQELGSENDQGWDHPPGHDFDAFFNGVQKIVLH